MRYLLALWFIPFSLFWGWYGLSANDVTMGSVFLSRSFHDYMFIIYGNMLGVQPETVPSLIAAAFAVDSAILMGVAAFTWRGDWYPQTKARIAGMVEAKIKAFRTDREIATDGNITSDLSDQAHLAK